MRLLHIDASPRGERSRTRRLTREFVSAWFKRRPDDELHYLDVGRNPPPHVDEEWVAAAFTSPSARTQAMRDTLRISDRLVAQLLAADVIVVGVPMYNFSLPSGFKAYIDQIARVGVTFAFEPENNNAPYRPLILSKRMIVIVAAGDGGYETGGRYERFNHVDPYLRTLFGFLGITDLTFVHVDHGDLEGQEFVMSFDAARLRIEELAAA